MHLLECKCGEKRQTLDTDQIDRHFIMGVIFQALPTSPLTFDTFGILKDTFLHSLMIFCLSKKYRC